VVGIDFEAVSARNPRIVHASISGFGQAGLYRERPGLDPIIQGTGGLMAVTGPPGTGPWRVGIAISDTASGTFLTQGVLAALFVRERTGRGQWVHTSRLENPGALHEAIEAKLRARSGPQAQNVLRRS
jgi:crotonobetainyl-CoA:carnitine CoA-transferase CaiB-like acyl-CoA transferase